MTRGQPPRLAISLLERCIPDNDPLTGDLLEEWPARSDAWFWRQVLLAVVSRTVLRVRASPRITAERLLVEIGMLALLGFYAVVAATLMSHLLVLSLPEWMPGTGRYQGWQLYAALPSFVVAVLFARMIGPLHRDHRGAAVLAYGASATTAAFVNLFLFAPNVFVQPFVPNAAPQIAAAMVFITGLFIDIGSRSTCASLPSA